jgi:hypothetical protein
MRCAPAGLDPAHYSAHGNALRLLHRGVPLPEANRQSRHRSVQQAAAYYNEVEIDRGQLGAARLVSGELAAVVPTAARRPERMDLKARRVALADRPSGAERDLASHSLPLGPP